MHFNRKHFANMNKKKRNVPSVDKNCRDFINRPDASPGYWLCCLLPLAFLVSFYRQSEYSLNFEYKMMTIASLGMCLQSINFFIYLQLKNPGHLSKVLLVSSAGLVTSLLHRTILQQSFFSSLFWGSAIIFLYQYGYIKILHSLPRCFSFGEACIFVQGLVIFLLNCGMQLPLLIWTSPFNEFDQMNAVMMGGLFCLAIVCWLLASIKVLSNVFLFYPLMLLLITSVCTIPVTKPMPIITIMYFIYNDKRRICIVLFFLSLVCFTICTVWWQLRNSAKASTRIRKIFHVLIVGVYVPGLLCQCTLLYIASGIAMAMFTVLELFRLANIPPLGAVLKNSFACFCDEKDAGSIALTPFCLLIGCSLPMWIHPCPCDSAGKVDLLTHLSGILSIGIGDAAASVIGSLYGKHKWPDSSRSYEGTFAFIFSQALAIYLLWSQNVIQLTAIKMLITSVAVITTAIVEAKTNQIDNLVLPLLFYIIINVA